MEDGLTHEVLTAQGMTHGKRAVGEPIFMRKTPRAATSWVWPELLDVSVGKWTRINCGRFVILVPMKLSRWSPVVPTRRGTFSTTLGFCGRGDRLSEAVS